MPKISVVVLAVCFAATWEVVSSQTSNVRVTQSMAGRGGGDDDASGSSSNSVIGNNMVGHLGDILQNKFAAKKTKQSLDPFAALNAEVASLPTPSPYAAIGSAAKKAASNPFAALNHEAKQAMRNGNAATEQEDLLKASGHAHGADKGKVLDELNDVIKNSEATKAAKGSKDLFDFDKHTRKVSFQKSSAMQKRVQGIVGTPRNLPTPAPTSVPTNTDGSVPNWFGKPIDQSTQNKLRQVLHQKLKAKEDQRMTEEQQDKKALARKVEKVMANDFAKEHLDPTKISPALRKEMEHVMKKLILKGEMSGHMPTAKDMWQQTEKAMAQELMQKEGAAVVPKKQMAPVEAVPVKEHTHTEDISWFSAPKQKLATPVAQPATPAPKKNRRQVPADWFGHVAAQSEDTMVCQNKLFAGTLPCRLKACQSYAKTHGVPVKQMLTRCDTWNKVNPSEQAAYNILSGFMMDVVMEEGVVDTMKLKVAVQKQSEGKQELRLRKLFTSGAWPFKNLMEQAISAQKGAKRKSQVDVQVINDWFGENSGDVMKATPAMNEILSNQQTYKSWLSEPATDFSANNMLLLGPKAGARMARRMPKWMLPGSSLSNAKLVHLGYRSKTTDGVDNLPGWTKQVAENLSPGSTVTTTPEWFAPTPAPPAPTPVEQGDILDRFKSLITQQNQIGGGATPVPTPAAWAGEGFLGRLKQMEIESKSAKGKSAISASDSSTDFVKKFDKLASHKDTGVSPKQNDWHKKIKSYLQASPTAPPTLAPTNVQPTRKPTTSPTLEHIGELHRTGNGAVSGKDATSWLAKFHDLEDEDIAGKYKPPTMAPTKLSQRPLTLSQKIRAMSGKTVPADTDADDDDKESDDDTDDGNSSPAYSGMSAQHKNLLKMLQHKKKLQLDEFSKKEQEAVDSDAKQRERTEEFASLFHGQS